MKPEPLNKNEKIRDGVKKAWQEGKFTKCRNDKIRDRLTGRKQTQTVKDKISNAYAFVDDKIGGILPGGSELTLPQTVSNVVSSAKAAVTSAASSVKSSVSSVASVAKSAVTSAASKVSSVAKSTVSKVSSTAKSVASAAKSAVSSAASKVKGWFKW